MGVKLELPAGIAATVRAFRDKEEIGVAAVPESRPAPTPRRAAFKAADRLTGLLMGTAIGDALGMPVEGVENALTLRAIRRLGGIRDFLAPQPHVLRSLKRLRPGCWTDDTQLSLAVARSVIEQRAVNYDAIADAHIHAFETLELRGWDATTKQACRRLAQGTSRARSGKLGGSGNGVAMKIAPIAAYSYLAGETRDELLNHCLAVGIMTHHDPRAVVGAYLIALLIRDALAAPRRWEPSPERYDEIIEEARWAEATIANSLGVSDDPISQHLSELSDCLDEEPDELADLCNGATSYVCNSVSFVVALLLGRAWEFEDGVIAAVNAGGDTDTNASMVGAILGAAYGARKLPRRYLDKVEESEMIRGLGASFAELFGA